MRLLLNTDEELHVREIARRLHKPSSHIMYWLKKLVTLGVVVREDVEGKTYYTPQPLFTENIEDTLKSLHKINRKVKNGTLEKTANCIIYFLQCYSE